MQDDQAKRQQAQDLQSELANEGLSRRAFLDRIKLLGVGFGAAYVLGMKDADAAVRSDTVVNLKSTNPALNDIIEEGRQDLRMDPRAGDPELDGPRMQTAAFGRFYARGGRGYGRGGYGRVGYGRIGYGRVGYGRLYGRVLPFARFGRFYGRVL